MQTLIELAPLIAFFGAYTLGGIYVATAVLMVAMLALLGWDWIARREIPKMHLISAILVWVFGTATLILHDVRFIQWKATVFYWLVAVVLAGSIWIGKMTLLERLMVAAVPEGHTVPPATWKRASAVAALFYFALGAANLWIAYRLSEKSWVFFKTWLTVPLLFVFTAGLMFWILRGYQPADEPKESS
jgi:intracellular septation protein